ncbi:hypothetical protein BDZ94DRAFT_1252123 [Collybia nuda]|uniref:Uncharacterized protein n=1 Tax=Collybia nuda TaxID=64659 RepID=A0A9P5YC82_9AGAR|nr:hypothetical protein BDZ94DRAFT_1252123 [Collybia nuda]
MQLNKDRRATQHCEQFTLFFSSPTAPLHLFSPQNIYTIYNHHVYIYTYIPSLLIIFPFLSSRTYSPSYTISSSRPCCRSCLSTAVCTSPSTHLISGHLPSNTLVL